MIDRCDPRRELHAVSRDFNGIELIAPREEVVRVMLSLPAGQLEKAPLANWARSYAARLPADGGEGEPRES